MALPSLPKTAVDTSLVDQFAKAEVAPVAPRMAPQATTTDPEKGEGATALRVVTPLLGPTEAPEAMTGESRLIVSMPVHLHRSLKIRCAERGITIRAYMLSLLEADGLR